MIDTITVLPEFGITLTLLAYLVSRRVLRNVHSPIANPIVVASLVCIAILRVTGIPISHYQQGGDLLMMLILPATICLAVMVYENLDSLKGNYLPIAVGSTVGAFVSIASVLLLSKLFGLSLILERSLLTKSVTTAIAIELVPVTSADLSIVVMSVIITGISGTLIGPVILRLFKVKNPVLQGIAMGTSSHVIGTSRAMELGKQQGAASSVALFVTGLVTVGMLLALYHI
jgi:putative effector of murein hydrolase